MTGKGPEGKNEETERKAEEDAFGTPEVFRVRKEVGETIDLEKSPELKKLFEMAKKLGSEETEKGAILKERIIEEAIKIVLQGEGVKEIGEEELIERIARVIGSLWLGYFWEDAEGGNDLRVAISAAKIEKVYLTSLAEELGLKETTEMLNLRNKIIEALKEGDDCTEDYKAYEDMGMAKVDEYKDKELRAKAQIALSLLKAMIFHGAGEKDYFEENINDAIDYAHNMGMDEVVIKIRAIWRKLV